MTVSQRLLIIFYCLTFNARYLGDWIDPHNIPICNREIAHPDDDDVITLDIQIITEELFEAFIEVE